MPETFYEALARKMDEELLGSFNQQDGSEDVLRAVAREQAVEATREALGDTWPSGKFPNFWDIIIKKLPRS